MEKDILIRIISVEPLRGKNHRYRIRLEGAEDICLYKKEWKNLHKETDDEISGEEYERIVHDILLPRAKNRALYLLERQDRTRANLFNKLVEGGYPSFVAEEALDYVEGLHYVDDERYVRQYIHYHKGKASYKKLMMDLARRGADRHLVERILGDEYDTDEDGLIQAHIEKKRYDPSSADEKERARMYRYLLSRGFPSEKVTDALRRR